MCNVCVAIKLMDGEEYKAKSVHNQNEYTLKGSAEGPELPNCTFKLGKNGVFTEDIKSKDCLADIVANGGFDINWEVRSKDQDEWIEKHFSKN